MDIFQLNLMQMMNLSLLKQFSGAEVMTSQPEVTAIWGRLGCPGNKNLFYAKGGAEMLFWFLCASCGSFLSLFCNMYFPYFTFMDSCLTVNLNHHGLGMIASICAGLDFEHCFYEDRDLISAGHKALCFMVSEFVLVVQRSYQFYFYELVVNCKLKSLWIGSNYIILCRFKL